MTTSIPSDGVRKAVLQRAPVQRSPYARGTLGGWPLWLRRLLWLLLIPLVLLLALVACQESDKPASLATSTLVGPRLTTGPVCLEEAVDVSGSMDQYIPQRERAERELFSFARRELARDDLLSEAFFASNGVLALPPSSLTALSAPPGVPSGVERMSTDLAPAVDALVASRSAAVCASRALVVITDGELFDEPAALQKSLLAGRYTRMFAVIPAESSWGRPSALDGDVVDAITVYHFQDGGMYGRAASVLADAKPLDVVFGDIVGTLTGQHLARADGTPTVDPST